MLDPLLAAPPLAGLGILDLTDVTLLRRAAAPSVGEVWPDRWPWRRASASMGLLSWLLNCGCGIWRLILDLAPPRCSCSTPLKNVTNCDIQIRFMSWAHDRCGWKYRFLSRINNKNVLQLSALARREHACHKCLPTALDYIPPKSILSSGSYCLFQI